MSRHQDNMTQQQVLPLGDCWVLLAAELQTLASRENLDTTRLTGTDSIRICRLTKAALVSTVSMHSGLPAGVAVLDVAQDLVAHDTHQALEAQRGQRREQPPHDGLRGHDVDALHSPPAVSQDIHSGGRELPSCTGQCLERTLTPAWEATAA